MPVAYWVISWKYSDSWELWVIVFTKMKQRNECGLDEEAAKNSTADLSRGPWQWVESPGTSFLLFMNLNFPEDAWTKSVLCTLKPTWAFVPEKTKANFFFFCGEGTTQNSVTGLEEQRRPFVVGAGAPERTSFRLRDVRGPDAHSRSRSRALSPFAF